MPPPAGLATLHEHASAPLILVVDDEKDARDTLQVLIGLEGYRVSTAANGAEAISLAGALRPALVITDLLMPVMDGIALAKALRADPHLRATRIVLCSGIPERNVRALFSGYDGFLGKPYALDVLRSMLRQQAPLLARPGA